jgi:hypothetical protein
MTLGISFAAGQFLTADDLQAMVDQIDSLTAPGWTSYTPSWGSSGTAPAIGNGTLSGRYRRAANSDLVEVEIKLVFGSTTTVGTGLYNWGLPVNAAAAAVTQIECGSCQVTNASDISQPGACVLASSTLLVCTQGPWPNTSTTINNRGGQIGAASPIAFGTGDTIVMRLAYQAA